jgi:hypothetical protein
MNSTLLGAILAAAVVTAIAAAASRSRPSIDPSTGNPKLRYHAWVHLVAWAATVGLPLVVLISVIARPENRSASALTNIGAILAIFAPLCGYLLPEVLRVSITWSDREIRSVSPWTGTRVIPWEDVEQVRFSLAASWFVIESRSGTVIRAHTLLSGLPHLVKQIHDRLDPSLYASCERLITNFLKQAA